MAPKWWLRLRSPDQQNRVADDAVRGNAKRAFAGIHPTRSPTSNSAARPDRNLMRGLGNPGAPFELDGAPQRRMTSMTRLPADNRLPHPAPLDCSRLCMPSRNLVRHARASTQRPENLTLSPACEGLEGQCGCAERPADRSTSGAATRFEPRPSRASHLSMRVVGKCRTGQEW